MQITNKEKVSLSLAVWLAEDTYDYVSDPNYISATTLMRPPRQIILANRIPPQEVHFDIGELISSSMGTALHDAIERAWKNGFRESLRKMQYPESVINRIVLNPHKMDAEALAKIKQPIPVYMEWRRTKKVGNYTVGGKFDFVGDGTLEDFKSTGVYTYIKRRNDEKYKLQGSIYRWLNPDIITSDYMLIQFIFTDWSKLRAMIEGTKGYPQNRVLSHKIPLYSIKWTEAYIQKKLNLLDQLKDAPEDELPECTTEELWQDPSVFKYYKNPQKTVRSSGNFDTYAEAHAKYLQDGSIGIIKEVKGQVKACNWCPAFDLCTQKNTYLLDETLIPNS